MDAKLSQTAYVPGTPFNLISVGDKVKAGWKVMFEDDQARLWKDDTAIIFDVVVNTPKGRLFGIRVKRSQSSEVQLVQTQVEPKTQHQEGTFIAWASQ